MINHLRTLLLNLDGSHGFDPAYPGEEFVDPSYRPVAIPQPLLTVRAALFGPAPDRAMLNYRLRQLLTCVHATELEGYAMALDPRITYWPVRDDGLLTLAAAGAVATQSSGPTQAAYVQGDLPSGRDKLYHAWRLDVGGGTATAVSLAPYAAQAVASYTVTAGIGGPVPLPNSGLRVSFADGAAATYLVACLVPPALGLAEVAAGLHDLLAGGVAAALFGPEEPYLTFGNLWHSNRQLPYRLAGLVTALAYRTEALRS